MKITNRIAPIIQSAARGLLFLLLLLSPLPGYSQSLTGLPPFGTFQKSAPGTTNLGNLNDHYEIPIRQTPGRVLGFSAAIELDTAVWYSWANPTGGDYWVGGRAASVTTNADGLITDTTTPSQCPGPPPTTPTNIFSNFVYIDRHNTSHNFPGAHFDTQNCQGSVLTAYSLGYKLVITNPGPSFTVTVYDSSGIALNNYSAADPNGNRITTFTGPGTATDSTGNGVLTFGISGTNRTYTYTGPNGVLETYQLNYTSVTLQTNFGCQYVHDQSPVSVNLLTSIQLPDGSSYVITYEQTPGFSANYTGRIASIQLPTGGQITYNYNGPNNGISCEDGGTSGFTKTTPDGTWTYSRSFNSTSRLWSTTVTDPLGNQAVYTFTGPLNPTTFYVSYYAQYETQRQTYQLVNGTQTLMETVTTCYNGNFTNCANATNITYVGQKDIYTYMPGISLPSLSELKFDSYGQIIEDKEFDFGAAMPPGSNHISDRLIVYGTYSNGACSALTSYMPDRICTDTLKNNAGTTLAQTRNQYDGQGNLLSSSRLVSGSTFLTQNFTYYPSGLVQTATDVNGAQTSTTYNACNGSFPTTISEPLGLTRTIAWDCSGEVPTSVTDENSQQTLYAYVSQGGIGDPFWRLLSTTDPLGNVTWNIYSGATLPRTEETVLLFNNNSSTVDILTTLDGLGRIHVQQKRESPTATDFDSVETDYDSLARVFRITMPYGQVAKHTCPRCPSTITSYDALSRISQVAESVSMGVSTDYSYSKNDVLVTLGPAPTGENTKRRQFEYDALARLTSVCELTSAAGSGTCGQNSAQTGYWTRYKYDALNNLIGVCQHTTQPSSVDCIANPSTGQQTRTYTYDGLSRITSETNAESGTTTYTYDSATGCTGTYSGDRVKRVDAVGNTSCYTYDALHRQLRVTYPSGSYASTTPNKYFVYDNATVNGVAMANAKSRVAEAYTCFSPCSSKTTDLGFSYTARGETSDVYELTPHSSPSYYHMTQTYWSHGALSQLSSNITGLPTINYGGTIGSTVGLDGEGRITQVTAASGQNPVTATPYNVASLPTQVTFGSTDTDIFSYDFNTMRMTQYQFNINGQSDTGALTWNSNGSLQKLVVTDAFNSGDNQTCNYAHDDLSRIAQADCGTGGWGQSFSYDPFGNITKNVLSGHTGNSFQPTYSPASNRFSSIPGATVSYDANGNVLTDGSHTYAWDADGNSTSIDSVGLTFDALDRMVEQNRSGSYTEIVYSPSGVKLALMSGQTLQKAFVPLPGQATAVYTSSGLHHYRHSDWLGSARLTSSPSRAVLSTAAYAPFGETYAQSGTADLSFTGQNQDTVSGDYDFLYREYSNQGRWPSPDPAGLTAARLDNPQSWNRYAYVQNNPLSAVDPLGLDCVYLNQDNNPTVILGDCLDDKDDGYYVPGTVTGIVTNDGQVTGVTLDGGSDVWSVGFDYNNSSSSSPDSSGQFSPIVPFVNPLESLLSTFAEGPVGRTIQNGVNLLGCTSNAVAGEIPFVGRYLSNSPDPVGNKLRSAAKAISPNPDAKTLGLIPNNLAVNTQRVVTTLDKLDLPQLSEGAAALASKFAPYASTFSKGLGIVGWSYMGYNTARNTSTCMKNGGPDF